MWLQDPLPPLEARAGADLLLTDDGWGPNIGIMYVRPTQCTLVFIENWLGRIFCEIGLPNSWGQ